MSIFRFFRTVVARQWQRVRSNSKQAYVLFGYRWSRNGLFGLGRRTLEIDPKTGPIVRYMYHGAAQGIQLQVIVKEVNAMVAKIPHS